MCKIKNLPQATLSLIADWIEQQDAELLVDDFYVKGSTGQYRLPTKEEYLKMGLLNLSKKIRSLK